MNAAVEDVVATMAGSVTARATNAYDEETSREIGDQLQ